MLYLTYCANPKGTHSASGPPNKTDATPLKGAVAHIGKPTPRQPSRCPVHLSNVPTEPHPATPPTITHIQRGA